MEPYKRVNIFVVPINACLLLENQHSRKSKRIDSISAKTSLFNAAITSKATSDNVDDYDWCAGYDCRIHA